MIHLQEIKSQLPQGVTLVAVSKYHPAEAIREAYEQGQRAFGESRVQELEAKRQLLPTDIEWHFIGHLQANKVKYIAPYINLIHAVDSWKLLTEINRQALKFDRTIPCLLEIHVAAEDTKYGLTPEACRQLLQDNPWQELKGVSIEGLMCMATNTDDTERVRSDFHQAAALFDELKATYFPSSPNFTRRSWGMSHDYPLALQERANIVRIGTAIFGERCY